MNYLMIHTASFGIALLLFFLSTALKQNNVLVTLLRLSYLPVIGSGAALVVTYGHPPITIIKGVLAFVLIGLMESIIAKRKRGEKTALLWVLFAVLLAAVLYVGRVLI